MDIRGASLGPNRFQASMPDGKQILFSYSTAVAAFIPGRGYIRDMRHYSQTTSRHVNKWLGGAEAEVLGHDEFEEAIK